MQMSLPAAAILLLLAAGQNTSVDDAPPLSPTFANAGSSNQGASIAADWWRGFDDPVLDALIDQAMAHNLDIAEAGARLDRARSGIRAADGARVPTLNVSGDATAARLSVEDPQLIGIRSVPGFDRNQERYAIGLGASWEIDLFGRLHSRARAARANAAASAFEVEAARLAVTTEIAERYVALRLLQQRRMVAARRADALAELARLSAMRVERGVSPAIERDRLLAEAQSAATAVPALTAAIEDQFARIDVLAGREVGTARRTLAEGTTLPSIAMIDLAATPADLLRRRPDVLAAEASLAAFDEQVSAALADRLPRFNLAGLIGTLAGAINPLFGAAAFTAQGSGGIAYNAFDGGRSRAAVDAAQADVRGAAARYQRTVLNAVADVEVAAAAATSAAQRTGQLRDAEQRLDATLGAVWAAQSQGALSLSDVLDVDRRLQDARDARLIAEADGAFAAIVMVRALGGGDANPDDQASLARGISR
jgi:NodT family efflux transporter outer membrane factor (OMF) lipoprotein